MGAAALEAAVFYLCSIAHVQSVVTVLMTAVKKVQDLEGPALIRK